MQTVNIAGIPRKIYIGWTGLSSNKRGPRGDDLIEIDSSFGQALGLENGQKVKISIHANATQATRVFLDPVGVSDWEIVETHSSYLESWMINQVRAVKTGQVINVYPSPTSKASLVVTSVEPTPASGFAILSPDSEMVVAPKTKKSMQKQSALASKPSSQSGRKKSSTVFHSAVLVRGVTLPSTAFSASATEEQNDFQPTITLDPQSAAQLNNPAVVKVSILPFESDKPTPSGALSSPTDQSETEGDEAQKISSPSSFAMAQLLISDDSVSNHAGLSKGLAVALGLAVGSFGQIIRVETPPRPTSRNASGKVIIHPYINVSPNKSLRLESAENKLSPKEKVSKAKKLKELLVKHALINGPITHKQQIPACDNEILPLGGLIELDKGDGWAINAEALDVELGDEILRPKSLTCDNFANALSSSDKEPARRSVVGIDDIITGLKDSIKTGNGGTLIYGGRGAGKTTVLNEIEDDLRGNLIYTVRISCGTFAEKPLQFLKDALKKSFQEACWYSPSVMILDDLEKIIGAETENSAATSSKSRQLAEIFCTLFKSASDKRYVGLLATASSKQSLHSTLISSHCFEEVVHLKSPSGEVRAAILTEALKQVEHADIEVVDIIGETEGYQPGDLWTLIDRANHEAIIEGIQSDGAEVLLSQKHLDKALKGFTPSSLRGVKLQKSTTSWKDIGGLRQAKGVILETLEWPTKYAPIFASSPLRLRSGLLLYGYPGCGKTFLASAVAAQCGLNFISVKGPEILNKYIGASEQSVRELFERASAAKPCVLFFDEFDSIAPKRGHDSTGVTDRVVNQMLTQMDGAEGLDGVYVLAATSRPDLIDSALLRPGRLDKSILCDIPDFQDRVEILEAVRCKMSGSPDIDLEYLAKHTEGYSGADLQALLYSAHLLAVHEKLDAENDDSNQVSEEGRPLEYFKLQGEKDPHQDMLARKTIESLNSKRQPADSQNKVAQDDSPVVICEKHMRQALTDTKASISLKERNKLRAIYEEFVNGRDGNLPAGTASNEIGGRATLM